MSDSSDNAKPNNNTLHNDSEKQTTKIVSKVVSLTKNIPFSLKGKFAFIKRSSFSHLRKNFFKYGIELTLIAVTLTSVGINAAAKSYDFGSINNRYLSYLIENPGLNTQIIEKLETESISVTPEKLNFILAAQASTLDSMMGLAAPATQETDGEASESNPDSLLMAEDSVIIKPNYATQDANQRRDVQEYIVQNGDSISGIASQFGVSVSTVLYENKLTENSLIKPGQTLTILPTTGIKHTVKSGETLSQISKQYEVDVESILHFNEIEIPDDILSGEVLIIPEGKIVIPESRLTQIASYNVVNVQTSSAPADFVGATGSLIWPLPTRNITQHFWSRHRALDISNSQRPQFWSAQDGIVELSGWQGAYGRTVIVNHGNGFKTRYAHASELYVSAGDAVTKGQVIGRVGNTGASYGPTGNHLHFEVMVNDVKVNPLQYVK